MQTGEYEAYIDIDTWRYWHKGAACTYFVQAHGKFRIPNVIDQQVLHNPEQHAYMFSYEN